MQAWCIHHFMSDWMYTCLHTCIPAYLHSCMHARRPARQNYCPNAGLPACITASSAVSGLITTRQLLSWQVLGFARLGRDFCSGDLPSKLWRKPGRKLRRKWRDLQRKQPETAVCAGEVIWPVIKVKWYITCIGKNNYAWLLVGV